jgi:predicted solute-binding protein
MWGERGRIGRFGGAVWTVSDQALGVGMQDARLIKAGRQARQDQARIDVLTSHRNGATIYRYTQARGALYMVDTKFIQIKVKPETHKHIKLYATEKDLDISELFRAALVEYLEKRNEQALIPITTRFS